MAGGAPRASDLNGGTSHGNALHGAFHGVTASKAEHIMVSEGNIHAHGKGFFQHNGAFARILYPQRSGNDIGLLEDTVKKLKTDAGACLLQRDGQGLSGFPGRIVERGHARNRI